LLHDRTADKIAAVVSRIPHAAATIVPFDVRNRLQTIQEGRAAAATQDRKVAEQAPKSPEPAAKTPAADAVAQAPAGPDTDERDEAADAAHMAGPELAVADGAAAAAGQVDGEQYDRPKPPPGVRPIGSLTRPGRATVEGRVYAVEIRPVEHNTVLATEIADSTGQLTALFYGRSHIPGLECGARVRFRGQVGMRSGGPVMINPAYELVAPGAPGQAPSRPADDADPAQGDSPKRRSLRRRKDT
ncbi:MAG TPA: OB-fold nucleic acid binding domain-containing protein, partial [Streptosporangiaceae bacterium]|nr:OB-fold nucleic acid binding domain-containing protein [Streptosporangiaceae bacterium]